MLLSEVHLRDDSPDRFLPFLDADLSAGFEWLSVKRAGKEEFSVITLSIHLAVLPNSFSCLYCNHIWQDTMMLCLTKILHSHEHKQIDTREKRLIIITTITFVVFLVVQGKEGNEKE